MESDFNISCYVAKLTILNDKITFVNMNNLFRRYTMCLNYKADEHIVSDFGTPQ